MENVEKKLIKLDIESIGKSFGFESFFSFEEPKISQNLRGN
jgi:hypothetical protein